MCKITVILNAFKRPQFLQEQINAIKNQTIKPKELMIWNNNAENQIKFDSTTIANSNKNFGVWSRFAYALNAKTEYICIFDDDTIPGNRWLENCKETIKNYDGLLGTIGLVFKDTNSYYPHKKYGWDSKNGNINNKETVRVDIVGHSWFFKREWLPYLWIEKIEGFDLVGEDMTFSYAIQKHLGLNTYVPPHPKHNMSLWGSIKGMKYSMTPGGISHSKDNLNKMIEYYKILQTKGFSLVNR
jgi:glycosyltransferase involved in cell wall biosynthesis